MLKLYGVPLSNFYNMVKHSLMEKGMDFEEVTTMPSQEPSYLAHSPRGKIPCLETPAGFLSETNVIMDYLEDIQPEPALYPADPYARAKAKEIMRIVEHYIETPSRRHLGHIMFGGPKSQAAVDEVRPEVEKGLAALQIVARFDPYIAGMEFGYADIFIVHAFGLAGRLMQAVYEWDIVAEVAGLGELIEKLSATENARKLFADQQQALEAMQAQS